MGPSGFHTLSDITWSIVYNAVPEIRLAGSVSVEWFLTINFQLLFTQGLMGVTETLRILQTIFLSTACISNVRLFGVYDVRWPFLAEIHTAPLKRFVPSSVLITRWSEHCAIHQQRQPCSWQVWLWRHDLWLASICDCGTICDHIMLQFVTRHDLWPKVLQFVTSVIQWFYSPSCAGGKLVFVFTLIMYTKWYNLIIYIYELW